MTLRPFRTALIATALYAVVLVSTASAVQHRVRVTLVSGEVMTFTVEVADGVTATAAQLPPLPTPTQTIEDLGPVQVPTPPPTPQLPLPTATPTVPQVPVPVPSTPQDPGTPNTPSAPSTPVTPGGGDAGQTIDPTARARGKAKR